MKHICIVAFKGGQSLDITGPLEVFSTANALVQARASAAHSSAARSYPTSTTAPYKISIASQSAGALSMSSGLQLLANTSIARVSQPLDTLIVSGSPSVRRLLESAADSGVARLATQCRRIAAVCTGAFVLAECGLLANKRATTHWSWCQKLSTYPNVTVDTNAVFVRDGNVWTSGGVTAGIDLALAMVEDDLGTDLAREVARQLVFFLRRPGGQSQFDTSPNPSAPQVREPMQSLMTWIAEHLAEDLSIDALANHVSMSPRNFARSFVRCVGETPARAVERARVEAACRQLERTDQGIDQIAELCGFGTPETMRRAFVRQLKVPPSAYRRRFSTSHRAA